MIPTNNDKVIAKDISIILSPEIKKKVVNVRGIHHQLKSSWTIP